MEKYTLTTKLGATLTLVTRYRILKPSVYIICVLVSIVFFPTNSSSDLPHTPDDAVEFGIIFTGEMRGAIKPIIHSLPRGGGLARRATIIEDYIKSFPNVPFLIFDGGNNLLPEEDEPDYFWNTMILETLDKLQYKYFVPGPSELLSKTAETILNQPNHVCKPISANLLSTTGQTPYYQPYGIVKIGKIKAGVIGINGDSLPAALQSKVKFLEPRTTLKKYLPEIQEKSDIIILIARILPGESIKLAREFPAIDLILGSHGSSFLKKPQRIGKTIIVYPGSHGKFITFLRLQFFKDWKLEIVEGKTDLINMNIPKSQYVLDQVNQTYDNINEFFKKKLLDEYKNAKISNKNTVAKKCKTCHKKEYKSWVSTAHAKAFQPLVDNNRHYVPECVGCHSTRYEEPGGFVNYIKTPGLAGVQCTACHDVVEKHWKKSVSYQVNIDEETCALCHDQDNSPTFNYSEYLEKISHQVK